MTKREISASLGDYQNPVNNALADLEAQDIMTRIWNHDYTIWKAEPTEISNRLGWLHIAEVMKQNTCYLKAATDAARADGYTHALLLGMGGSSLAPEVFRKTFGVKKEYLDLAVLDSTTPGAILDYARNLDLKRTLFIVSTKSGGTVETLSFFRFFYNQVASAVGEDHAGEHFIAITDPGSKLADMARQHSFRETFLNDPNIGGRYSALSYFGLAPAMMMGADVSILLDRASAMMEDCKSGDIGFRLGVIMGEMAKAGRDKLTLFASPPIAAFGAWAEQLIAESTGKEGAGILPVDGELPGKPGAYGKDRLFVYLRLKGDDTHDKLVESLRPHHPVVQIDLDDIYDLGSEFFRWELATAIAGHILGINPFDQPDVESAKELARQMVADYQESGKLPSMTPKLEADGITVYSTSIETSLEDMLRSFAKQSKPTDYVAIHAYLQPDDKTSEALQKLRILLRDRLNLATTVGYGPRFLHSTGQLHKGDAGNGLFIQLTADDPEDADIPHEAGSSASSISFSVLKSAQALGDLRALLYAWRRVIRFHLGSDVPAGLKRLTQAAGAL